jgi:hypothetical protein
VTGGRGGLGKGKQNIEGPVRRTRGGKGRKRKNEPQGLEVEEGFLLKIIDVDGEEEDGMRPQKQRQKRHPSRFSDKEEQEVIGLWYGQV